MRILKSVVFAVSLFILAGCSSDVVQILEHPTIVKPGSVITVKLSSAFLHGAPGKSYWANISRDSLHVLLGLPEGWSVEGVDLYAAKHYKAAKILAEIEDFESVMNGSYEDQFLELEDSLAQFESRKSPMPHNPSLNSALSGRSISARSYAAADSEVMVSADDVSNWNAYSSPVDIQYQAMTETDTFIVLDEAMKSAIQEYMPEMTFIPDTVGVTAVPFFVYATIRTGEEPGEYDIYYYSKTNSLSTYNELDQGSMTYATVVLDPDAPAPVRNYMTAVHSGGMRAIPAAFSSRTRIQLPLNRSAEAGIDILSLRGQLVRSFTSIDSRSRFFVWNGTDQSGREVKSGTYIVRHRDRLDNVSHCVVRKLR